mmetsp:Transcript_2783/g.8456  ORF Transcript_2783/g.8456 Transcript_2783/m.8456 type:complete len:453 (-) Transcript_2783:2467-3825(-)
MSKKNGVDVEGGFLEGADLDFGLTSKSAETICCDEHVVLVSSDGIWCLGRAGPSFSARIGRKGRKVLLAALVGAPWGSTFELKGRGLARCSDVAKRVTVAHDLSSGASPPENSSGSDTDRGRQKLSQDEIERLKMSGAQIEDILKQLTEGSSSFEKKNAFAKEKYLQRKEKQYRFRVQVRRPCARTLCHVYYFKSPEKTMHMRYDALGMMINTANVKAFTQVTVIDQCNGLLLSAATERLGGYGRIFNLFTGRCPSGIDCTRWMNFEESVGKSIIHVPISFYEKINEENDDNNEPLTYANNDPTKAGEETATFKAESDMSEEERAGRKRRKLELLAKRPMIGQLKSWIKAGSDSLLIAARSDAFDSLISLLTYVRPSASFALYNPFIQPLAEIQHALSQTSIVSRVQLLEVSMLHHQMIPGRTHPLMRDDIGSTAGFVLSGIRVEAPAFPSQ